MDRPHATFDPTQNPQQQGMMGQPEKPYGAYNKSTYLNPQSPYIDHAASSPVSNQGYDPSHELSHRVSSTSTAVSPHALHFEGGTQVPSPEPTSGYFAPPPPGGYSELSQGYDGAVAKGPGAGEAIPMQLRAGSPPSQIHSSVHEVAATRPRVDEERWELPSRT